jgi:hypothetical protein
VDASIGGDAIAVTGGPITISGTLDFQFAGDVTQYINGLGNLIAFPAIPVVGVTSVAQTHGGDAFVVGGSPITSSGTLVTTMAGTALQYVNGLGDLALLSSIPVNLTLTTNQTTGASTWDAGTNTLNIPNYTTPPLSYTTYVELLSQFGVSAPVGTVLENTAGYTPIVWSYTAAGQYVGTFGVTGITEIDKTTIMIHTATKSAAGRITAAITSFTGIVSFNLETFDTAGAGIDDQLLRATLEIRDYA